MDRYEDVEFYLEEGYGERLGYTADDYLKASDKVHFVSREESFGKDITMILKNPEPEDLEMLRGRIRLLRNAPLRDPSEGLRDYRTQRPPNLCYRSHCR